MARLAGGCHAQAPLRAPRVRLFLSHAALSSRAACRAGLHGFRRDRHRCAAGQTPVDSDSALVVARVDGGADAEIGPQAESRQLPRREVRPSRTEATATEAAKASCEADTWANARRQMRSRESAQDADGPRADQNVRRSRAIPLGRSPALPASAVEPASGAGIPDSRQGDLSPSKPVQAQADADRRGCDRAPSGRLRRPRIAKDGAEPTA